MPAFSSALLSKFLKGLCTEEEAEIVEEHFRLHPEDVSMLDEFEEEDAAVVLPAGFSEEMRETVVAATKPAVRSTGWVRIMVAAACVLLVVVGLWLMRKSDARPAVSQVAAVWVGRHNADSRKIQVMLPDSSEVILSPGTTIRYRKDFGHYDKREVKVEGQAQFSVMKNEHQPFVVMSEMVRTVVLGTVFEVMAEKDSAQIRVRLVSGKVMVALDTAAKQYLLAPGQELVYGKWNGSVVIRGYGNGPNALAHRGGRPGGKPDSLFNWYMFNNQPMADVLTQLSTLYNVEIDYSKEDLRNIYFIGRLEKKDSLGEILRDIALLNHLTVTRREGRFIITKRKP